MLIAVAACGSSQPAPSPPVRVRDPEPVCKPQPPAGSRADVTPSASSVNLDAPQICGRELGDVYIHLEHVAGKRHAGMNLGCKQLPRDPESDDCPVIDYSALFDAASAALHARNIKAGGTGLGPCYTDGDSRISMWVRSWRDAGEAVDALAAVLDAYRVNGEFGIAIRGTRCYEFSESPLLIDGFDAAARMASLTSS